MGEAILVGRSTGSGSSGGGYKLVTKTITSNTTWLVPEAKDQLFHVRIFGGGGGGGADCSYVNARASGGGGGYMNNGTFTLSEGDSVSITIGKGGVKANYSYNTNPTYFNANTGGTTSFGSYLSAAGGKGGYTYSDITNNTGYSVGGNGGSGGGGSEGGYGGHGFQFGGGGGGLIRINQTDALINKRGGGNGGTWGGGGGAGNNQTIYGYGGIYGGNGGANGINATNGTNTIGLVGDTMLEGPGLAGVRQNSRSNGMGGGGYGGNGGHDMYLNAQTYLSSQCGAGGGGYGADGGNAVDGGGGGGGYGKYGKGGDGSNMYYSEGGGGGAYGPGGSFVSLPAYGGGGRGKQNGAAGICIIQYYEKADSLF